MLLLITAFIALAALVIASICYAGRNTPKLSYLSVIGVLGLAGGFYSYLGAPGLLPILKDWHEQHDANAENIILYSNALKSRPDDWKLWAALGQAYMEEHAFPQSADAYKHAVILSRGNSDLILQYNKALIFEAGGIVSKNVKQGLEVVLLQDKTNLEARYFLALWNLQNGNNHIAMREMKSIYHALPDNAPLKHVMDRQIGRE